LHSFPTRRSSDLSLPSEAAVERDVEPASRVGVSGHIGFAGGGDERPHAVPFHPGERPDALRREATPRLTPRHAGVVGDPYAAGRRTGKPPLGSAGMNDERRDATGDVVGPHALPVMLGIDLRVPARGATREVRELTRRRVAEGKGRVLVEEGGVFPWRGSGGGGRSAVPHRLSICERARGARRAPRISALKSE